MTNPDESLRHVSGRRIQLGCRIDKNLAKIFRAFGDFHDIGRGDVLEIILVKALKGQPPLDAEDLAVIEKLMKVYELNFELFAPPPQDAKNERWWKVKSGG